MIEEDSNALLATNWGETSRTQTSRRYEEYEQGCIDSRTSDQT